MGTSITICNHKLLRITSSIIGVFLLLVPSYFAQAVNLIQERKKKIVIATQNKSKIISSPKYRKIQGSKNTKVKSFIALDQFLKEKIKTQKLTATQIKYITIAYNNFHSQGEKLFAMYDDYLSSIGTQTSQKKQKRMISEIYKLQKATHNAFWETFRLLNSFTQNHAKSNKKETMEHFSVHKNSMCFYPTVSGHLPYVRHL